MLLGQCLWIGREGSRTDEELAAMQSQGNLGRPSRKILNRDGPGMAWVFLCWSEVDDGCWLPREGSWPLSKVVLCRHTKTVDSWKLSASSTPSSWLIMFQTLVTGIQKILHKPYWFSFNWCLFEWPSKISFTVEMIQAHQITEFIPFHLCPLPAYPKKVSTQ